MSTQERTTATSVFMLLGPLCAAGLAVMVWKGHSYYLLPAAQRPLSALHAQRYVDTRLALIGDAAHGIHPIAGQGLNLGFRDILALSDLVLAALAAGEDPGSPALLAAYQRRRRPANLAMLAATDVLDRLFSTDNPILRAARDFGIATVDRIPTLKKAFMRAAMGT